MSDGDIERMILDANQETREALTYWQSGKANDAAGALEYARDAALKDIMAIDELLDEGTP